MFQNPVWRKLLSHVVPISGTVKCSTLLTSLLVVYECWHLHGSESNVVESVQGRWAEAPCSENQRVLHLRHHHLKHWCALRNVCWAPLLFDRDCQPIQETKGIINYADYTTVLGLISNDDKQAHRREIGSSWLLLLLRTSPGPQSSHITSREQRSSTSWGELLK